MVGFREYQYEDLLARREDPYAGAKYRLIVEMLGRRERLRVLNAGCGAGDLSVLLAAGGHRVTGIDVTAEYIDLATGLAQRLGVPGCEFRVASIEEFQPDEPYDWVVATDVLEHIADDRAALMKLVSMTKPGGHLAITVPAGQWLFGYHDEQLGHYRRYSARSLRHLADGICRVDDVRHLGFTLIPVCYLYSKRLRRPYPVRQAGGSRLAALALKILLGLEAVARVPSGTSLLMRSSRPAEASTPQP